MKILGIELSSCLRSVAVYDNLSGESSAVRDIGIKSTSVFGMISKVLEQAGIGPEQIQQIAVGLGPGSYTGIRIAISAAQGWGLARNVKLKGISSVECMAAGAWREGRRGDVYFAVDAQRREFYLEGYVLDDDGWRVSSKLALVGTSCIEQLMRNGCRVLGPGLKDFFADKEEFYPDAETLAKLASKSGEFMAAEELKPIYLRPTAFIKAPPPRFSG